MLNLRKSKCEEQNKGNDLDILYKLINETDDEALKNAVVKKFENTDTNLE